MLRFELRSGCYLRLFEESDAEELARVIAANRAYLADWLDWANSKGTESSSRSSGGRAKRLPRTTDSAQRSSTAMPSSAGLGLTASIGTIDQPALGIGWHGIDRGAGA